MKVGRAKQEGHSQKRMGRCGGMEIFKSLGHAG